MVSKTIHLKIKYSVIKITTQIRENNFIISLLILFSLFIAFYLVWTPLYYFIGEKYEIIFMPTPNETIMQQPFVEQILATVILGPIIETLLSQKWLYSLLSLINRLKGNKIWIVIIGGIIFGLLHFYSLSYIVYNIFMGVLFMSAYILRKEENPFLSVAALHALTNLFVLIIDPIEKMVFG